MKSNNNIGVYYGILATVLWGSYPLWYKPLSSISSPELLGWRIVWSVIFLILLVAIVKRNSFKETYKNLKWLNIFIMSLILSIWWLTYIYGILTERILEVALGYFISPIISLFVSQLIFKEKTNIFQKTSIFLVTLAVFIMVFVSMKDDYFPWIAITIGICFSLYGIAKRDVVGDPVVIQTFETLFLLPFAIIGLFYLAPTSNIEWNNSSQVLLLISTGIISVLPLWWYSISAKKLTTFSLSFIQFIPPTINFLLAVFIYKEALDDIKILIFAIIWIAISMLIYNNIRSSKI